MAVENLMCALKSGTGVPGDSCGAAALKSWVTSSTAGFTSVKSLSA